MASRVNLSGKLFKMAFIYKIFLLSIFGFAVASFILLLFVSAPYGKFFRKGWGATLKSKYAWLIMEFPSPALMAVFYLSGTGDGLMPGLFLFAWLLHYLHRTFIYPFTQSGRNKPFPAIQVLMAFIFNILNGTVNGYHVFHLAAYTDMWLTSWQFILGAILFVAGFLINRTADKKLRKLRPDGDSEYKIPRGWLFSYISCPHYFGEIIEWLGWAVMTFSPAGLAFFVFTFANLFPRALIAHKWYRTTFPDYPVKRKAIIPFVI